MLVIDPTKRITLDQILQDKWYTEGYENEVSEPSPALTFTLTPEQHRMVLDELEEIGLERQSVEKSLQDGDYDPLAATYYLVADKRFRQKQSNTLSSALATSSLSTAAAPNTSGDATSHKSHLLKPQQKPAKQQI
ncbi:hypothetical protein BSLG_005737 [Batrachochytrium salamandrivorans]|nr:hypothetical protein BSLG_005737 [Batrachochytrium salamandrivorans]